MSLFINVPVDLAGYQVASINLDDILGDHTALPPDVLRSSFASTPHTVSAR